MRGIKLLHDNAPAHRSNLVHGYISQSGTRVYLSIWYTGISPNLVSLPIWYIPNLVHGYISQSGARVYLPILYIYVQYGIYLPIWYISQSGTRVYLPIWYISQSGARVYFPVWYTGISPSLVYLPVWYTDISPNLVHGYISHCGTRVYLQGKPSNLSHAGSVQPRILHHVTFCFHVIIKKGIFRTQRHLPLVHPSRSTVLQCQDHTPRETKNRHLNNGCKGQIKRSV